MSIGSKLKALRTYCGLTQEELADRCELTKGYISQLENDLTSPSISTLTDILTVVGSDLKTFFSDEEEQIKFTKDDYFVKKADDYQITWLIPNCQKNEMEPILFRLEPHASSDTDMPHEGQEFGYVSEGEILVVYGNKQEKLSKGESFYFTTDKNHYIKNLSDKVASIIWVSSPPNF